ncbi:MAG: hypothetical protein LUB63_07355, partial [Oscillospiraceae bacterium]|nr:hypothetical protein [Oscillospiraceae bacterium]
QKLRIGVAYNQSFHIPSELNVKTADKSAVQADAAEYRRSKAVYSSQRDLFSDSLVILLREAAPP